MELRILQYFLMVAREENITKAAQRLHITQPTLSRQLMQLEEELGVTLFRRSNHSIALTEDGLLLRRRAQELIDLAEKTKRDFVQREDELSGEITFGSGEIKSISFFAQALAAFQEMHPKVRYHLHSANADDIKERIDNGLLDLGLLVEPVDISKYAHLRLPRTESWSVLAPSDLPLASLRAIRPEDLQNVPLLMSSRAIVQNELAAWFGNGYDTLNVVMTYNLLYNAAMLAREGIGCALCIELDCAYEGLRFIPLEPPLLTSAVLVWKKNQATSPVVTAFIEHAKKYISGISNDRK